jgi:hypothetical protein
MCSLYSTLLQMQYCSALFTDPTFVPMFSVMFFNTRAAIHNFQAKKILTTFL